MLGEIEIRFFIVSLVYRYIDYYPEADTYPEAQVCAPMRADISGNVSFLGLN